MLLEYIGPNTGQALQYVAEDLVAKGRPSLSPVQCRLFLAIY
jgi:hypothetical protein